MREEAEELGWWTPTKIGFALTALVLAGFALMASQRNCVLLPSEVLECRSNWAWFLSSPPNEVGDTLAGFAGALAFVWIIITVWIQGHELREQRKELGLTRSELKLAREAQEKQLDVMQKQVEIIEHEKQRRVWDDSKKTLDELIRGIAEEVKKRPSADFRIKPDRHDFPALPTPFSDISHSDDHDEVVQSLAKSLTEFSKKIYDERGNLLLDAIRSKSSFYEYYFCILVDLDYALLLHDRLAEDQQLRLMRLKLGTSQAALKKLMEADIWEHQSK